jgi:CHASE2 domain-containing sensor protein
VNVGYADRAEIGIMLQNISDAHPKVIGLDVRFEEAKDPAIDDLLKNTLRSIPNLVVASRLNWENKKDPEEKGYFINDANDYGYVNFIGEDQGTIRYYSPNEKIKNQSYLSFTAALLKQADPSAYQKLQSRKREIEDIHYKRKTHQYLVIETEDILEGNFEKSILKNAIVLVGYINDDPNNIEDKHFTPMNPSFAGKSKPDMNGLVIHANILSMLLDGSYIKQVPAWLNWIFTLLIAWLHMALFMKYYLEDHIWFHLVAKLAQVVSAIFFVYLSLILYHTYSLKLDMKLAIIIIILAIDVIYFYEAFALWMHKKTGFKTVFNQSHH